MIFVVELGRCMVNIYIFGVIIYRFNHWWKVTLRILLLIDRNLKICFQYNILCFYLTICLGINDDKKFLLNIKKVIL